MNCVREAASEKGKMRLNEDRKSGTIYRLLDCGVADNIHFKLRGVSIKDGL